MMNGIETAGEALRDLATKINTTHAEAVRDATSALGHARQCGELLNLAKEKIPHGGWLPWLAENCTVDKRQSQRYMKIAANWDELKNDLKSHLTIEHAAKLTSKLSENGRPAEIRQSGAAAADHAADSQRLPDLDDNHSVHGYDGDGRSASIIPIGGGYHYVGVIDFQGSWVHETRRGIRWDYVGVVLDSMHFKVQGEWTVRQVDDYDRDEAEIARRFWFDHHVLRKPIPERAA